MLRDNNVANMEIMCLILDRAPAFKNESKRRELCLTIKYHIIFQKLYLLN